MCSLRATSATRGHKCPIRSLPGEEGAGGGVSTYMVTSCTTKLSTLSLLLLALAAPACALEADEGNDTEAADDELAASRVKVVGSIGADESKSVAYTASPKYRGFTYAGKKGDQVTLRGVAANGAIVRLWVLGSGMKTLASNSAKNGGDLRYTLKSTGSFTFALATSNASSTTITLTAKVPGTVHAVSEAPGESCDGTLTSAGMASMFTDKPLAGGGDWSYTGNYHAGAVRLGDYTRTSYTRSCSSSTGGCTAWTPIVENPLGGNTGYLLAGGDANDFRIALRSKNVVAISSGVPQYPCYHNIAGYGYGATVGDPSLDSMTIRDASTCSNDAGPNVAYRAVATDTCFRAVHQVETSRRDFGDGAYTSTEKATVFYAAY